MITIRVPKSAGSRTQARELVALTQFDFRGTTIMLDFSETKVAAPSFVDEVLGLCFDRGADFVLIDTHAQRIREFVLRSAQLRDLGSRVDFTTPDHYPPSSKSRIV